MATKQHTNLKKLFSDTSSVSIILVCLIICIIAYVQYIDVSFAKYFITLCEKTTTNDATSSEDSAHVAHENDRHTNNERPIAFEAEKEAGEEEAAYFIEPDLYSPDNSSHNTTSSDVKMNEHLTELEPDTDEWEDDALREQIQYFEAIAFEETDVENLKVLSPGHVAFMMAPTSREGVMVMMSELADKYFSSVEEGPSVRILLMHGNAVRGAETFYREDS